MGIRLIIYLTILIIGYFIGNKGLITKIILNKIGKIQTFCLFFLILIMGIKIGLDKQVVLSFFKLGYQATVISIFSIAFSILFVYLIKPYIKRSA